MPTPTTTAARATETGISSRGCRAFVLPGLALAVAACGGGGPGTAGGRTPAGGATGRSTTGVSTQPAERPAGPASFSWLRPARPPAGWRVMRISSGATVPYPPAWRPIRSDPGTASAAQLGPGGSFIAYLNITPRQGQERVSNWIRFRPDHNAEEGDRHVKTLAIGRALQFRTGRGACIRDSYATATHHRYIELACIVAGRRATTVVVGAAPPGSWSRVSPLIERAISGMTT